MKIQGLSLLLVLLTACSADFIPFSGGALQGNLTPAPDDWTQVTAAEVIQLETNPAQPYSEKLRKKLGDTAAEGISKLKSLFGKDGG